MVKKPIAIKTRVTADTAVIELSLKNLRTVVADYNQFIVEFNRQDPREKYPIYRIKNGKAFMKYILQCLITGRHTEQDKLPVFVTMAMEDILMNKARRNKGLQALPCTSKDAEGMRPARRR